MGIHMEYPAPPLVPFTPLTLLPLWNFDHGRPWSLLVLVLLLVQPATAQSQKTVPPPPPDPLARLRFDKTMAVVLVILIVVFFILGFISIYTRHCAEQRMRGRFDLAIPITGGNGGRLPGGLDRSIIETFPTFIYSDVKSLKIGRATLECAVCLNEFGDDETLRLIPKCSHVFHPECIDVWLVNHSTCPVCRANLVPKPGDMSSSVAIPIPDPTPDSPEAESVHDPNCVNRVIDDDQNRVITEPPRVDLDVQNRPVRSRSTGLGIARLFPRSHSTGHSLVRPGEDCERFTLRLPEEVRNRLVNTATLNRTKSCGVTLQRESSGRRGYRTRSVGRNYLQYERFGGEDRSDRWGFRCTPSFLGRPGSVRSPKNANKASMAMDEVNVGERSSDRLFYNI